MTKYIQEDLSISKTPIRFQRIPVSKVADVKNREASTEILSIIGTLQTTPEINQEHQVGSESIQKKYQYSYTSDK